MKLKDLSEDENKQCWLFIVGYNDIDLCRCRSKGKANVQVAFKEMFYKLNRGKIAKVLIT